ncbi:uncharacterized protein At4g15970-like [Impatiens glandulifera]|uniref:uncharacterized protein At4g15970-like n=1 Tax=Impatiens glandulifera TaxID=253017 RepID=UPI001FB19A15|nr:uncharacterized protein At4g15970-like [Impatiens glandulifera]
MEWDRSSGEGHRHKSRCGFENWDKEREKLKTILNRATMKDGKTVILTTLNNAWAAPNSVFDIFLESFEIGNDVKKLLNHLVVIALDYEAYSRCLVIHFHCYAFNSGQWEVDNNDSSGEAYFMTSDYLEMMWKRIDFLQKVLELGFNFVFTDADIMWFRDPFPKFHSDVDFHIACDYFTGDPWDLSNLPNGGFTYVKSNERTIEFYRYWYDSRMTYPGLHDQEVLDKIKNNVSLLMGVKIMFLDTRMFGGFCEPSKDFNQVCTMHANCCFGLDNKVHDLKILLDDWRNYLLRSHDLDDPSSSEPPSWNAPKNCSYYYYQIH